MATVTFDAARGGAATRLASLDTVTNTMTWERVIEADSGQRQQLLIRAMNLLADTMVKAGVTRLDIRVT